MAKKFTVNRFIKAGFTRVPEMDYISGGYSFKILKYKEIYITYVASKPSDGDRKITVTIEPDKFKTHSFTYEDYMEEDWYKLCYKFHNIPEDQFSIDELINDLEIIINCINNLEEKVNEENIDIEEFEEIRKQEVNKVLEEIENFKQNYNCKNVDRYHRRLDKLQVYHAQEYIQRFATEPYSSFTREQMRKVYLRYKSSGWVDDNLRYFKQNIHQSIIENAI